MTLELLPTPIPASNGIPPRTAAGGARSLEMLRPAFIAEAPEAANGLERLLSGEALCVTTGQQPGLLTGPLFTPYKALSAIALARSYEAALGRSVVPVFWVAGDDHDFAEANHTYLLDTANEPVRLSLRDRASDAPLTPLYREPVGDGIRDLLATVESATPPSEFRDEVLNWIARAWEPRYDMATAFARAMADLLGSRGLLVFQPWHPAAKRAMAPLLVRALELAGELDEALAKGPSGPVTVGDGATTVMIEGSMGRDRLVLDGDSLVSRRTHERCCVDDIRAIAETDPEKLSPNVLLRPVVEAALLPTATYVAGPGELAYLPQCGPIYRMLEVTPQAAVPRWSGLVIEGRVRKVLDKYGIAPGDLVGPEGQIEARLVRDEMPPEARDALAAIRTTLRDEYQRLETAATGIDPTLRKPVQSALNAALAGTGDIEKRIVSHLKQADEVLVQQVAKARHNLYPLGKPQERVLNLLQYLVRYGPAFVDQVLNAAEEHMAGFETPSATV